MFNSIATCDESGFEACKRKIFHAIAAFDTMHTLQSNSINEPTTTAAQLSTSKSTVEFLICLFARIELCASEHFYLFHLDFKLTPFTATKSELATINVDEQTIK